METNTENMKISIIFVKMYYYNDLKIIFICIKLPSRNRCWKLVYRIIGPQIGYIKSISCIPTTGVLLDEYTPNRLIVV